MPSKYLTMTEAAREAGLTTEQLNRLREQGEIRGFSDGGTWKFKADDISALQSRTALDQMLAEDSSIPGSSVFGLEEEDLVSEQPTIISGDANVESDAGSLRIETNSDSDVKLVSEKLETDHGEGEPLDGSDSDVQLVENSSSSESDDRLLGIDDDSDIRVLGDDSDSDVKLVADDPTEPEVRMLGDDSDSDVKLIADGVTDFDGTSLGHDSDSDVQLAKTDFEQPTELVFDDDESGISLGDGSSIMLAADSDLGLEDVDSDVSFHHDSGSDELQTGVDESGISLEGFESDIDFEDSVGDSEFAIDDDSGIELTSADSGIAFESLADSGLALDDVVQNGTPVVSQEFDLTGDDATAEVVGESEFELSMDDSDDNVVIFDDEEDIDDRLETVIKKSSGRLKPELDDLEPEYVEDADEDYEDNDWQLGTESELDELPPNADEEIDDLESFEEEEFEDDLEPEPVSSVAAAPAPVVRSAPAENWGVGPMIGLVLSASLMVICGLMMFDLVRSLWTWNDPSGFNEPLIGISRDVIN